jgi:hypothetical protein
MWRRVVTATMAVIALMAGPASAQQPPGPDKNGTDLFITVAVRVCDRYIDISANKSRNNIQESLRDLGLDTKYKTGQLVNPAQEQDMQPKCRPLTGFRFSFGPGISPTKVIGAWGSLSVTNTPAFRTDVTTLDTIPDRDGQGVIKPNTSIEGASTIELSAAERQAGNNLVLQGGTPDDPVLDKLYPNTYAFGALRCSDDNVNGDNVEYARFS